MRTNHPKTLRATAVAMAAAAMLMSTGLQAGIISNSNATLGSSFLGDCGPNPTDSVACVGAWNLGNVDVELYSALDGSVIGTVDKTTGVYPSMAPADFFASFIKNDKGARMARVSGKVWPVGEPTGIKVVNGDSNLNGKPQNCLINTAFLDADASKSGTSAYLDTANPEPVVCSSEFQTHKRFKIAMLPATVEGIANGAEGKGIDLVFNIADNGQLTPYQVFSKINNYTGKRLKGYKIVVGQGIGDAFESAGKLGIADKLHISLGIGEGSAAGNEKLILDGSNIFDDEGMATFSHGLFGAPDKHFTTNGFFDTRTAGFNVEQECSEGVCTTYDLPLDESVGGVATLKNSDTIYSTTKLPSNYAGPANAPLTAPLFGEWLPSTMQPSGIFWDTDGDPTTDAQLMAWWDGSNWRKNNDSGFAIVGDDELKAWGADPAYGIDTIEDVLNLGINYIVKVGDGIGTADSDGDGKKEFTIRIIPVVADDQTAPAFVALPAPEQIAPVVPVTSTSDGGGCSAATGERPVDPVLPLLAALGLIGWGLRRARRA